MGKSSNVLSYINGVINNQKHYIKKNFSTQCMKSNAQNYFK